MIAEIWCIWTQIPQNSGGGSVAGERGNLASAGLTRAGITDKLPYIASRHDSPEGCDMNQLTVRGFDDELDAIMRGLAKREGISLNQAALRLLRKGAGLTEDRPADPNAIGDGLDDLFGAWSQDEAESFDAALKVFDIVDEAAWR